MLLSNRILLFGFLIFMIEMVLSLEFIFNRAEFLNPPYLEGFSNISNFRVSRVNRTTYAHNFEFEMFIDLPESIECKISTYYNGLNNN